MCLADFLAENAKAYIRDKCVLELGAGGGLPSLVSVLEGASKTVATDFPDASLLSNIEMNVFANIPEELRHLIMVEGYTWGSRTSKLLEKAGSNSLLQGRSCFDTILAADLVFNHSQHLALLQTCEECLSGSSDPVLLCFYAHHRPTPELITKDEGLVKLARARGWTAEKVVTNTQAGVSWFS
ncbi:MAG: nicotinamide n-methyltransferase [Cyphobasidiales sp. Tagirdzhanova-0007]|nr:MAG: nicotinamide n-methyltransferase [Cyphobasidiales sp. Tagirdzhanova-0007]